MLLSWIFHLLSQALNMFGIIPITITSPSYRTYPYHLHHLSPKICMVCIPPPIPIAAGRQLHIVPSPLNGFFWLFPTILNIFSFVFFIYFSYKHPHILSPCSYLCVDAHCVILELTLYYLALLVPAPAHSVFVYLLHIPLPLLRYDYLPIGLLKYHIIHC